MSQRRLSPFGRVLRQWRTLRGSSQFRLATESGISTRHLSFLETGRSTPSREMVLRLSEALDVPLRERNALLAAAGFAPLYRETALEAPEMEPVSRAIDFLLERQEPFPAYLVDRSWRVQRSNHAGARLFARFAGPTPSPVWRHTPANLLRLALHPEGLRPHLVNRDEAAGWLVARLQREVAFAGPDEELALLLDEILALPDLPRNCHLLSPGDMPQPLLPLHLKRQDLELRVFSMITTIGTPQDITLQDRRIETFMPADATTEAILRGFADGEGSTADPRR